MLTCKTCNYWWRDEISPNGVCHADRNWPAPCELDEDYDPEWETDSDDWEDEEWNI